MSTIIKVLKKLEISSTSLSRQPDSHNIKMVIKNRNEKLNKNYKINYIMATIIIILMLLFLMRFLPEIRHIEDKPSVKERIVLEQKIDHFADKIGRKKLDSENFVRHIEQKSSLIKINRKEVKIRKKKQVNWNVNFQLSGILKYGAQNKRKACINNKWVKEGDMINGITIIKIGSNSITIQKDNQERVINLH